MNLIIAMPKCAMITWFGACVHAGRARMRAAALVALLSATPMAHADSFAPAGAMLFPRSGHPATLLLDGRVLFVGGTNAQAHSEIYDPRANAWRMAAPMPSGRSSLAAVLLRTGKVLVLGSGLSETALYDPAANRWTPAGPLAAAALSLLVAVAAALRRR